jgi:2-methylcitrate dehydratase PrpD
VLEGVHGFFHAFAHATEGDYSALINDFGTRWVTETLAFKAYPCGTMTHPYIDCARRLAARGIKAEDIVEMVCDVGEGTVHRLWEPLAAKQRPANGYAGKVSTPYCIAAGLARGNVGLGDFTDTAVKDPRVVALAEKVRYRIDPQNPYPKNFTGHIRAMLRDGTVVEERQPHMRGGAHEPLTRADIEEKFVLNVQHGGWSKERAAAVLRRLGTLFDEAVELSALRG